MVVDVDNRDSGLLVHPEALGRIVDPSLAVRRL
jgi:hypothetical protein